MSFLVLLLVLVIEKFSGWRGRIQRDGLWLGWLDTVGGIKSLSERPWLGILVAVLPPLLLLALLLTILDPVAYGLLALPVQLLVVVWSLGRGDVLRAIGPFRDAWRREDAQGAYHVAERDLGVQAESDDDLLAQVQGTLVWQAYQAFFAVIFWYALLGPVAALAYRLLAIAADQGRQPLLRERAAQLRHAFDWLPARALVLSFALVGNFVAVTRMLLHDLLAWDVPAARLLARAGYVAEDFNEGGLGAKGVASLDALWQLLVRSAVLWYAVFAVWTLLL
ncbi:regulatory signaling modulator protein AmpE [Pseudomonas sp. CAN2814]|uniref:regulatory signaling modulator protein AmpE n=1 Tax=Pseudomonas sp. CAN1 TaxID=3046726 RepID=UPI00264A25EB|nr:regulatory signaling modulator protein AmpE [Pseudomonas sp. CAN1]MDN6861091.1 regulatory signaling modulator protein AmpE [Pseudomonas sp. CAN1]